MVGTCERERERKREIERLRERDIRNFALKTKVIERLEGGDRGENMYRFHFHGR